MKKQDPVKNLLGECARMGIREYVVCAGARNAPIVLPLLRQEEFPVYHHFEERSAAFFALGRAKQLRAPVAVVTTSGTAVAELLPAIVEAHYQQVPLVAITGDRPLAYRGSGAPQVIEQPGLFGDYVEICLDVETAKDVDSIHAWTGSLPLHVNVRLDEPGPVSPPPLAWPGEVKRDLSWDELNMVPGVGRDPEVADFCSQHDGLLVMLGAMPPADYSWLESFLVGLNAPVLADASSNLREAPRLSALVLRGGELELNRLDIRKVLRIGGVPSFRYWRDLESLPEVEVLSITSSGYSGLARESKVVWPDAAPLESEKTTERGPREAVTGEELALEGVLGEHGHSEPALIRRLSERIPMGAGIFLGNSLAIREWNLAATFEDRHFTVHANRGANGIDGIVSTFLGVAAGEAESWLICGDLTALYDLAGPWIANQLPLGKRRIVVLNNGGGRIFDRLPAFAKIEEHDRTVIGNSHDIEFSHWAMLWGWRHRTVTHPDAITDIVDDESEHLIVEVRPDSAQTAAFWEEWGNGR